MIKEIKEEKDIWKTTEKYEKRLASELLEIKISLHKISKRLNITEQVSWRKEMKKLTRQRGGKCQIEILKESREAK